MVSPRSLTFVGATLIWGSLVSSASCAPLVFWLSHFLRNSSSFVEEWCIKHMVVLPNDVFFCLTVQGYLSQGGLESILGHYAAIDKRCEELT